MEQVFLALAAQVPDTDGKLIDNPYKNWSDIDKSLPNVKINVFGPPTTSGTRDSLHELFLEVGAKRDRCAEGFAEVGREGLREALEDRAQGWRLR